MSIQETQNIFDDIVLSMINNEPDGSVAVRNYVRVEGQAGIQHTLTVQQLMNFGAIMGGTHPTQLNISPLQFVAYQYQLQDLIALQDQGRGVAVYKIHYSAMGQFIKLTGLSAPLADLRENSTTGKEVVFEYHVPNIGAFAGVALLGVIVNQSDQLLGARHNYNTDFEFVFDRGAIKFRSQD
jgi:hypothetical protein